MHAVALAAVSAHFEQYALNFVRIASGEPIPGSYWGEPEAGLIASTLYYRDDTPVHSVLHEACHFVCMPTSRRQVLHTNAGGDDGEENAVCYLQIVLGSRIEALGAERLMMDMDAWGYSFRLGSARAWFESDAEDAHQWLLDRQIIAA